MQAVLKEWLQAVLENRLQLHGPFVFTIRPEAPLYFTRKQVRFARRQRQQICVLTI